jgi:hypothetical protein
MANEFDKQVAEEKHYRLMKKLIWAKERIDKTTDYYYSYPPQDEESWHKELRSIYDAAKEARDELVKVMDESN